MKEIFSLFGKLPTLETYDKARRYQDGSCAKLAPLYMAAISALWGRSSFLIDSKPRKAMIR
jgi:hypothetical protein